MSGAWKPILDGARRDQALSIVGEIAEALRSPPPSWIPSGDAEDFRLVRGGTLAVGLPGLALLYAYIEKASPGRGYGSLARENLGKAIDLVASLPMEESLFRGFTGVAWTEAHLARLLSESANEDPLSEIDDALLRLVSQSPWQREFDLWKGLAGLGVYFLERLPADTARRSAEQVVARLEEAATHEANRQFWRCRPETMTPRDRERFPQGYLNLGVAHGSPAVIAVLGRFHAAGIAREQVDAMLARAIPWLLAQRNPEGPADSFPNYEAPGREPHRGWGAWCYGAPGVAAALWIAARGAGRSDWQREALEIARTAARRRDHAMAVRDAGTCHGSGSLAQIYNRFHQATGDLEFKDAASFWLDHMLRCRTPGKGVGGYRFWGMNEDQQESWLHLPGLMHGSAGVALVLLAAATDIEPAWDRLMLLSG